MEFSRHFLQFVCDSLLIAWKLRTVIDSKKAPGHYISGALIVSTVFWEYASEFGMEPFRTMYRVLAWTMFLLLCSSFHLRESIYMSCFALCILLGCRNVFITPILGAFAVSSVPLVANPLFNMLLSLLLQYAVYLFVFYLFDRLCPLHRMLPLDRNRFSMVVIVLICEVYIRHTVFYIRNEGFAERTELSIFIILLQIALLLILILFDQFIDTQRIHQADALQEMANRYMVRDLVARERAEDDIRKIHHDMKNHLLAIEKLADDENSTQIAAYTRHLRDGFASYDSLVSTGNRLMDGLISAKISDAKALGIEVIVHADFSSVSQISNADFCTIFGNAFDNAIEACRQVGENLPKIISITTEPVLSQLVIRMENSYQTHDAGELKKALNGNIQFTTKRNPLNHGYGLMNIRSTIEKYGAVMDIVTSIPGRFCLVLIFPTVSPRSDLGETPRC